MAVRILVSSDLPSTEPVRSARILCADDSSIQLRILANFLGKHGYPTYCVNNGLRALDLLLENPGVFDLLITDYQMPVMDGLTLAKHASLYQAISRIIFLTASSELRDLGPLDLDVFFRILEKPFNPQQLLATIQASLAEKPLATHRPVAFEF